jgi:hypothetical protein
MKMHHFRHVTISPTEGEIFFDFYKVTCKVTYKINEEKQEVTIFKKWGDLESFPPEFIQDLEKKILENYKTHNLTIFFSDLCLEYKTKY